MSTALELVGRHRKTDIQAEAIRGVTLHRRPVPPERVPPPLPADAYTARRVSRSEPVSVRPAPPLAPPPPSAAQPAPRPHATLERRPPQRQFTQRLRPVMAPPSAPIEEPPPERTYPAYVVDDLRGRLEEQARQHNQAIERIGDLVSQTRAELHVERQVRTELVRRLQSTRGHAERMQAEVAEGYRCMLLVQQRSALLRQALQLPWYASRRRKELMLEADAIQC